jgi:alpha-glucosidase
MNNSTGKNVILKLDFLPAGDYEAEIWADSKNSDKEPMEIRKSTKSVKSGDDFKVIMAKNGGFVAVIKK